MRIVFNFNNLPRLFVYCHIRFSIISFNRFQGVFDIVEKNALKCVILSNLMQKVIKLFKNKTQFIINS